MSNEEIEMNKKDKHVEVICKKFDLYKSEMDKEFLADDYPFYNLEPWTNYYVEGPINAEDLAFEKWFDENYAPEKLVDSVIDEYYTRYYSKWYNKEFLGSSIAEIIVGSICMILIFGFIWL